MRALHFFNHIQSRAKDAVPQTSLGKTEATPTLTGLPPHITILVNYKTLRVELETSKVAILTGVEAELDKRCVSLQSHFNKDKILEWMITLHNELLKKVDVCGQKSANAIQNARFAGIGDGTDFNDIFVTALEEVTDKSLPIPSNRSKKFHFFYSNGEVKHLPSDFVFPHMTLYTLVTSWFCGNPSAKNATVEIPSPSRLQAELLHEE